MIPDIYATGAHILIRSSLLSSAAAIAATDGDGVAVTGALAGTASSSDFDSKTGFDPTNGAVTYTNFARNGHLASAGQVCADFTLSKIADADEAANVSASRGEHRSASGYLFSFEDSAGNDKGRLFADAANAIRARPDGTHADITKKITSVNGRETVRLCLWWCGVNWGVMVDGAPFIEESTRAIFEADYYKLIIGTNFNGTSAPFDGRISNVVVSTMPPRMRSKQMLISPGIFGDSYAVGSGAIATLPTFQNSVRSIIESKVNANDYAIRRWLIDGNGGFTVCDTGATDLSSEIAAFVASQPTLAIIPAGNNDMMASDAQIDHATTGTEANYKKIIQLLMFTDYSTGTPGTPGTLRTMCEHIILYTARSLKQDASIDTLAATVKRDRINAIIKALVAWYDATYPAFSGRVHVVDIIPLLGDNDDNINYQGYWEGLGNLDRGGSAAPVLPVDNAHPSAYGYKLIGDKVAGLILQLAGMG